MMKNPSSDDQAEKFHYEIVELIKKYQFRDRNRMTCCGVSVSQCYVLETLHRFGPLTMNDLADKMYLKISTMTRVVEQLVIKGYATREEDNKDRRFRRIRLTENGEKVYKASWENVFGSEKTILNHFPPEQRETLIQFLRQLNRAVEEWRSCCSK